ncbi:hypothetical protein M3Y97_00315500 [Aphelenchoides bicaudatus]|nr:hypothetical protein M3Y97_00315500 [Aphelenchoides bicaudatus]
MNTVFLLYLFFHCALFPEAKRLRNGTLSFDLSSVETEEDADFQFIKTPALFQPLGVRFIRPSTVNFSRLAYFDLESRPFDVLPSADVEAQWRRVATKSNPIGVNLEFGCEWLTATGLYRIRMRAIDGNETYDSSIARLDRPLANDSPKLQMREDSIFPHCQHDFDLSWRLPNCTLERKAASDTFRIRLSAVQADGMEIYMGELKPTTELPHRVGIPCAHFDIIYVEFCFELLSVQPFTRQLDLWDRRCLSTEPVLHVDGGWSEWLPWSQCSKSCGNARRKRRRECNNPKPQTGRFCQGKMVESEPCNLTKCPKATTTTQIPRLNVSTRYECKCGCLLSESGAIHVVSQQTECQNGTLIWKMTAHYLAKLRLVFIGRLVGDEHLRIIDANGQEMYRLSSRSTKPNPIIAMFPLETDLSIEFEPDNTQKATNEAGLILDYELIPAPQPSADGSEYSVLLGSRFVSCQSKKCHAVMTILSLLVCLVTIMVLVAVPPLICSFIARRRIQTRKYRSKKLLESLRGESEMIRSGGTDSTQLSSSNHSASKPPLPPTRESNGTVPSDPDNSPSSQ